ncbi:MAG: glycerophosphodiester phosphodiesterase family protein [Bacteroidota bacterium]
MKEIRYLFPVLLLSLIPFLAYSQEVDTPEFVVPESLTRFPEWSDAGYALISAHRGGPYPGYPENAIETFQNIIDHTPAFIECDVMMTRDSVLVLMHDYTLDRTTTGTGRVSETTYQSLQSLYLVDNEGNETTFKIPTLDEALAWGKGKALFTLDIKRGVPFDMVLDAINRYDASRYAAVITYRMEDAQYVHRQNADVMISVSAGSFGAWEQLKKSGIPYNRMLGFMGTREPEPAIFDTLKAHGIWTILGTLGNLDRSTEARGDELYLEFYRNGADILATDRPLEVHKVLQEK